MAKFKMKDFGFVSDCKTRYLDENGCLKKEKWYGCWYSMVNRCYNVNNREYRNYGGKGVSVSDEFKRSSVYRDWFLKQVGDSDDDWCVDKDILCEQLKIEPKIYSMKTCLVVTRSKNSVESHSRQFNKDLTQWSNSKHYSYYSKKDMVKGDFLKMCRKRKWSVDDFDCVFYRKDKNNKKRFLYILKQGKEDLYEIIGQGINEHEVDERTI